MQTRNRKRSSNRGPGPVFLIINGRGDVEPPHSYMKVKDAAVFLCARKCSLVFGQKGCPFEGAQGNVLQLEKGFNLGFLTSGVVPDTYGFHFKAKIEPTTEPFDVTISP